MPKAGEEPYHLKSHMTSRQTSASYSKTLLEGCMIAGSNVSNMAARSLIMDLLESPNGTLYGILIAFLIVILTTGLYFAFFIDSDNDLHPRSIYFRKSSFAFLMTCS